MFLRASAQHDTHINKQHCQKVHSLRFRRRLLMNLMKGRRGQPGATCRKAACSGFLMLVAQSTKSGQCGECDTTHKAALPWGKGGREWLGEGRRLEPDSFAAVICGEDIRASWK